MKQSSNRRRMVIQGGTIVDGCGDKAKDGFDLVIQDGVIVEQAATGSVNVDDESIVVDATGCTVMPGIVDAHFHVSYCNHLGMQELEWPKSLEYQAACAVHNAAKALRSGVTSALDVGGRGAIGLAVRQILNDGLGVGPRLKVSAQMIDAPGGGVDLRFNGISIPETHRLGVLVSGASEVRSAVRQQIKLGVDNIKLVASGSTAHPTRSGGAPTLSVDEISEAVRVAHEYGVTVAAHAEGEIAIRNAIEGGVDTIHHATNLSSDLARRIADEEGPSVVFTLGVYRGIVDASPELGYPRASQEKVRSLWNSIVESVSNAAAEGVPFAVGSDCGGAIHPHGGYGSEIALLVSDCGLSIEKAVQASTERAARAAGFSDRGTLGVGSAADLLIIDADLRSEAAAVADPDRVSLVIQDGRIVKKSPKKPPQVKNRE